MKFIRLKKAKNTPFETILQFGCGPNFVANRFDVFKLMIKEQGLLFWFRFWFLFSNDPGVEIAAWIKACWPILSTDINIMIHHHLLKGSYEDAAQYCLFAIEQLRASDQDTKISRAPKETFKQLVKKIFLMAFGASMCVLFHKWLNTKEIHNNTKIYWTTPTKYLDPTFNPGILEKRLVKEWDDNLLPLLDIHLDNLVQVPWLLGLMYESDKENWCLEDEDVYPLFAMKHEDLLRKCIHQYQMQIAEADERLAERSLSPVMARQMTKCDGPKRARSISAFYGNSCFRRNCSYCKTVENTHLMLKKCKRCLIEEWEKPKRYCSVTCQLEHWFIEHCKEHQENK